MPTVPQRQADAFQVWVADRLGLDPQTISDDFHATFEIMGDDELAKVSVTLTAYLPAAEVLAAFNQAGEQPSSAPPT